MATPSDKKHGGRREGAGRPHLTDAPLIPRTIRLTAEEWATARAEAKRRKLTTGRLIAEALRRLAGREGER